MFEPVPLADGRALSLVVAEPDDAPATLLLERAVLAEGRWFMRSPAEAPSLGARTAEIRDLAAQPNSLFLLARVGGSLLGFLTLHGGQLMALRHVARLTVMVDARARGLGVGRALVEAGVRWAEANPELRKLSLAVFIDNTRAIALYQRMGFAEEGRREGEYLLPDGRLAGDLLMWRAVG